MLGNEFETDIALFRFQLADSVVLPPGSIVAKIVLTTVAEALASASAKILDIEESDIGAEFRVAMTPGGQTGGDACPAVSTSSDSLQRHSARHSLYH